MKNTTVKCQTTWTICLSSRELDPKWLILSSMLALTKCLASLWTHTCIELQTSFLGWRQRIQSRHESRLRRCFQRKCGVSSTSYLLDSVSNCRFVYKSVCVCVCLCSIFFFPREGVCLIARIPLNCFAPTNWVTQTDQPILYLRACTASNPRAALMLIRRLGAKIDAKSRRDKTRDTALITAVKQGNAHLVALLLEHGASPTVRNDLGQNAIDVAQGNPDLLSVLVERRKRKAPKQHDTDTAQAVKEEPVSEEKAVPPTTRQRARDDFANHRTKRQRIRL